MTQQNSSAFFLERYNLSETRLQSVMDHLLGKTVDYADLYFEYQVSELLQLEEGRVTKVSKDISQGVGVRAVAGEKTGYAYSDDITQDNLLQAAKTARYIANDSTGGILPIGATPVLKNLYPVDIPPVDVAVEDKMRLLGFVDKVAREYDPRIGQVMVSYAGTYKHIYMVNSFGEMTQDLLPLIRLNVTCVAEENGRREIGSFGGGGRYPFSFFHGTIESEERCAGYAKEAARRAVISLSSIDAPAGPMEVVLGPGWPGILLHEAIGHGLEADFNRKGLSAFSGRLGEKVASERCTVVDDGTLPGRRGSLNCDDEGVPTSRTVLIENGILKGYLFDRMNARLMKMPLTGNGRRESYAYPPMPRMTNTFMLAGDSDPETIIRSVKRGVYATSFGGGQVDITSGKFVFSASEAYLIEDGKIGPVVKGATLMGNGPDILTKVTAVGNDLALDSGVGTCGKEGQSVPVGVGLPTIKISEIIVGGTG